LTGFAVLRAEERVGGTNSSAELTLASKHNRGTKKEENEHRSILITDAINI
jgi:hypothetical protein